MNKIFISILLFALILTTSCDFKLPAFAGSYAYSEDYYFDISKKKLIDKIINFKIIYPQHQLTENDYYEWFDDSDPIRIDYEDGEYSYIISSGYTDTLVKNSIWFHCSFYFLDIKARVNCVINVSEKAIGTPTLLRLVSYCPAKGKCKTINQREEISRKENRMIKRKFETEILDKLGIGWRHQYW